MISDPSVYRLPFTVYDKISDSFENLPGRLTSLSFASGLNRRDFDLLIARVALVLIITIIAPPKTIIEQSIAFMTLSVAFDCIVYCRSSVLGS